MSFAVEPDEFKKFLKDLKEGKESNPVSHWVEMWCKARTIPTELRHLSIEEIKKLIELAEKPEAELTDEEKMFIERYKDKFEFVKKNVGGIKTALEMYRRCCIRQWEMLKKKYAGVIA